MTTYMVQKSLETKKLNRIGFAVVYIGQSADKINSDGELAIFEEGTHDNLNLF